MMTVVHQAYCWHASDYNALLAQVSTVVDERLLVQWRKLTHKVPKASLTGFLASVVAAGAEYGSKVRLLQTMQHAWFAG